MNCSICVSIITPSYNQGMYLEQTIQSVLNQTYGNIEYLAVDGGSTDNSIDIIKKYEKSIAYWISEPDNGQANAINKGFKHANGELVCWVNSDDILYPDYVNDRVRQFKEHTDADMIYGDVEQGPEPSIKRLRKGRPRAERSRSQKSSSRLCTSSVWSTMRESPEGLIVPRPPALRQVSGATSRRS